MKTTKSPNEIKRKYNTFSVPKRKHGLLIALAFLSNVALAETSLPFMKKQIFFRNDFAFNDGQSSSGASAFLISYQGNVYVATAKHMLNESMGIEPKIAPSTFSEKLDYWLIQPPTGSPSLHISGIVSPNDDWDNDIILLTAQEKEIPYQPLKVALTQPKEGDVAYIIGCPYEEKQCQQNAYKLKYITKDGKDYNFLWENKNISSRGFSGAPIVDKNGNVLAVYNYHHDEDGIDTYVGQSVLDELQRISQ